MELKNKTILITGGTSGLGLHFTRRLVELGNAVIITGRNTEKLAEAKQLYPGMAKMFRVLSCLAPGFLLSQTSKAGVSFYQQA